MHLFHLFLLTANYPAPPQLRNNFPAALPPKAARPSTRLSFDSPSGFCGDHWNSLSVQPQREDDFGNLYHVGVSVMVKL